MPAIYFINGEYNDLKNGQICPDDVGVLRGYGVFDFFRTYNGLFFLIDKHLDRFFRSAKKLNIDIPFEKEEIKEIAKNLKKKSGLQECSIRVVATGGRRSGHKSYKPKNATFFALCQKITKPKKKHYQSGVKLVTLNHQRILPEAKHNNYLLPIAKKKELKKENGFDFLYVSKGQILESVTSNFFLIKEGKIITPEDGVLKGATRGFLIEAVKDKFQVEKRDVSLKEVKSASEAFITSTSKEVLPVVKIDNIELGSKEVGEITKKISRIFKKEVKKVTETK